MPTRANSPAMQCMLARSLAQSVSHARCKGHTLATSCLSNKEIQIHKGVPTRANSPAMLVRLLAQSVSQVQESH